MTNHECGKLLNLTDNPGRAIKTMHTLLFEKPAMPRAGDGSAGEHEKSSVSEGSGAHTLLSARGHSPGAFTETVYSFSSVPSTRTEGESSGENSASVDTFSSSLHLTMTYTVVSAWRGRQVLVSLPAVSLTELGQECPSSWRPSSLSSVNGPGQKVWTDQCWTENHRLPT